MKQSIINFIMENTLSKLQIILTYFGLTWQVIIQTALAILCLLVIYKIFSLHGVFQKIRIYHIIQPKSTVIFVNKCQKYQKNQYLYEEIKKDIKYHFKISKIFGQYHDDPSTTINPRVTMGIIVNPGEKNKIKDFMIRNSKYRLEEIPQTQCIGTSFPYVSKWSSSLVLNKVYSKIKQEVQISMRKELYSGNLCVFQVYHFLSGWPMTQVEVMVALQNHERFNLWKDFGENKQGS